MTAIVGMALGHRPIPTQPPVAAHTANFLLNSSSGTSVRSAQTRRGDVVCHDVVGSTSGAELEAFAPAVSLFAVNPIISEAQWLFCVQTSLSLKKSGVQSVVRCRTPRHPLKMCTLKDFSKVHVFSNLQLFHSKIMESCFHAKIHGLE